MFRSPSRTAAASATLVFAVALVAATPARSQTAAPARPKATAKAKTTTKAAPRGAEMAPLDLNKATAEEMTATLPGVGEVTASKIVAGRPYRSVDDLKKAGVTAREVELLRPLVTVVPPAEPKTKVAPRPKMAAPAEAPGPRVDLNTATAAQLETLPGVGPTHAREIIAARPFAAVDDLGRVKGLGKARIDAIRDRVTLSPPAAPVAVPRPAAVATTPAAAPVASPGEMKKAATRPAPKTAAKPAARPASGRVVNLNTATREELDALPGIGPVKAAAILEYRQAQPFKTREDVMKVKGIKDGEFAKIRDLVTVD